MEIKELLTAVRVVCAHVAALPHVAHKIDEFLWAGISHCTLESASKRGFVRLLDRLLMRERPGYNSKCRVLRLSHAIESVLTHRYDIHVLKWWLRSYMPDQSVLSLASLTKLAIERAQLPVLEWLYQETKGDLPHLQDPASCYDAKIVVWTHEHGGRHLCGNLSLYGPWRTETSFHSIQKCFAYEDEDCAFEIQGAEYLVANAIKRGELEALQWFVEHRPKLFKPDNLDHAVHHGRLEVAKWLLKSFPQHFFSDPFRTFSNALFKGPVKYDFGMAQWIISKFPWVDENKRLAWMNEAMLFAADLGKLELLEFIHMILLEAFKTGQTTKEDDTIEELALTPAVMDAAAANCHLNVVQWLYQNGSSCTTDAMDKAAKGGHLEMIQWLHENRSEGCSTNAMGFASGHGHVRVVKWLHENRSEGCTTFAMNSAAENGHLEIVRWLHENRTEGCTSDAMDFAAAHGHLDVVQFLHAHRNEGCTKFAQEYSAARGHFDTFRWLHENRPEPFAPDLNMWERKDDGMLYRNILKCQAFYTIHDRLGWFVDELVMLGDFETVELLLSEASARGVSFIESRYVEFF